MYTITNIGATMPAPVVFRVQNRDKREKQRETPDIKETEVMYRFIGRSLLIAALVTFADVSVFAQKGGGLSCRQNNSYNDRLVGNCEIREQTLAPTGGTIAIDGRQN